MYTPNVSRATIQASSPNKTFKVYNVHVTVSQTVRHVFFFVLFWNT